MSAAPLLPSAARAADLVALGFQPIPLRATGDAKNRKIPRNVKGWQTFAWRPADWQPGEGVGVRCGPLEGTRGGYLYALDFDAHHPGQNGPAHFTATLAQLPTALRAQLALALSTSRTGRYIFFTCDALFPAGTLRTVNNTTVGEFLAGGGRQVVYVDPDRWLQGGYETIPHLPEKDAELVLAAAGYWPSMQRTGAPTATIDPDDVVVRTILEQPEILEENGIPRACGSFTASLLRGERLISDASAMRWAVCKHLFNIGYASEEIIGYVTARCAAGVWAGKGKRGAKDIYDDVVRIVGKLEAQILNRRVNKAALRRCAELRGEIGGADRNSRRGRPPIQPEQRLASFLTEHPDAADWTTAQLADALGCTDRTIRRYRAALRGADNNSVVPAEPILSHQDAENAAPPTTLEATCSPQPPACPPPAEAEPVHLTVAQKYRTAIAGAAADGRATARRVRTFLETYFPDVAWSVPRFRAERDRWRRDRADDELRAWATGAEPPELRRRARSLGRRHADAHAKGNAKQAFVFGRMAQFIEREIADRQARGDWPPPRGRRKLPADPPLLVVAAAAPPVPARPYATPIHAWYAAMRAGNAAQACAIEARCRSVDWADERQYFAMHGNQEARGIHATY